MPILGLEREIWPLLLQLLLRVIHLSHIRTIPSWIRNPAYVTYPALQSLEPCCRPPVRRPTRPASFHLSRGLPNGLEFVGRPSSTFLKGSFRDFITLVIKGWSLSHRISSFVLTRARPILGSTLDPRILFSILFPKDRSRSWDRAVKGLTTEQRGASRRCK